MILQLDCLLETVHHAHYTAEQTQSPHLAPRAHTHLFEYHISRSCRARAREHFVIQIRPMLFINYPRVAMRFLLLLVLLLLMLMLMLRRVAIHTCKHTTHNTHTKNTIEMPFVILAKKTTYIRSNTAKLVIHKKADIQLLPYLALPCRRPASLFVCRVESFVLCAL